MAKLWQKKYSLSDCIEEFTVGLDYILDRQLIGADCAGSIAHARMLTKQGYLTDRDCGILEGELRTIYADFLASRIDIKPSQEDCHTYIEERLSENSGEIGRKIHLGRSRNDQLLTALRLYGKEYLLHIQNALYSLISAAKGFAEKHEFVPMPGRTHLQIAMPSSIGLWAGAFAEELLDAAEALRTAFVLLDRSPLGTAASYGVPLDIDREYTASLMGFASVQNNVLAVQNSRGRLEALICDCLDQIGIIASRISQDIILFSLPELNYLILPDELCTGSSIMPQKKNPDALELVRSRSNIIAICSNQIKQTIRSLPSGYNRDLQDCKEPFIRCLSTTIAIVRVMEHIFTSMQVQESALRAAHVPEIYATDEVIALAKTGIAFREAYKKVSENLNALKSYDPDRALKERRATGYPNNLKLSLITEVLGGLLTEQKHNAEKHFRAMEALLGSRQGLTGLASRSSNQPWSETPFPARSGKQTVTDVG